MAFNVSWYEEQRVILTKLNGNVTLDELKEIDRQLIEFIRAGTPLVHLIVDMTEMDKMPTNVTQVNGALQHLNEDGLGWTILVGASPIIRFVGGVVAQIARMRFRALPTFSEALTFLTAQDSTLQHLVDSSV
jgi:hypothetical protein